MNYKTPEQILEDLYNNSPDSEAWKNALDEIHAYANNKTCECPDRSGATTNWTCNVCGKIVDDIECKLDNFIAA